MMMVVQAGKSKVVHSGQDCSTSRWIVQGIDAIEVEGGQAIGDKGLPAVHKNHGRPGRVQIGILLARNEFLVGFIQSKPVQAIAV